MCVYKVYKRRINIFKNKYFASPFQMARNADRWRIHTLSSTNYLSAFDPLLLLWQLKRISPIIIVTRLNYFGTPTATRADVFGQ